MSDELSYRFDDFLLDVADRQLWRGGTRVDLNARYFDALELLVRRHGQLVEKDQLFSDVWGDVVVSDSALTQCIKEIRKSLGDNASNPRYVETVPRYGYRFIGIVEEIRSDRPLAPPVRQEDGPGQRTPAVSSWRPATPGGRAETSEGRPATSGETPATSGETSATSGGEPAMAGGSEALVDSAPLHAALIEGAAGTVGGGVAGVLGGLVYGFGLAHAPGDVAPGAASILFVLVALTVMVGLVGGFGVSFGMAAGGVIGRGAARRSPVWRIAGALLGGMFVGGMSKMLGVDAFNLLFGRAPAGITGGMEGAALGLAVGLGAHLGGGVGGIPTWRPVAGAAISGAVAGILIPLAGGRLMGGSLELVARSFAGSRLQLDALGRIVGDLQFGFTSQVILGGVEGLLFGACVVGAIVQARRLWLTGPDQASSEASRERTS